MITICYDQLNCVFLLQCAHIVLFSLKGSEWRNLKILVLLTPCGRYMNCSLELRGHEHPYKVLTERVWVFLVLGVGCFVSVADSTLKPTEERLLFWRGTLQQASWKRMNEDNGRSQGVAHVLFHVTIFSHINNEKVIITRKFLHTGPGSSKSEIKRPCPCFWISSSVQPLALFSISRLKGFPAATPSPTRTWTKAVCVTTPACVSVATLFPAAEFTPGTLSR